MLEEAIDLAVSNGIWAVLFVCLLAYLLKDSNKREKRYCALINDLSLKFCILKKVDKQLKVVSLDVAEIKTFLFSKRGILDAH